MGAAANIEAFKKEVPNSEFIPYGNHVTDTAIKLVNGDYISIIKCQGAAHESADAQDLNLWHSNFNNFMKNLASPNTAVWSHVVRREVNDYPEGEFINKFARDYNEKYRKQMTGGKMLVNELYVTIVYRPYPVKVLKLLDMGRKGPEQLEEQQLEDLEALADATSKAMSGLERYEPKQLGIYERNNILFSSAQEFLGYLVDGEWRRKPLAREEIRHTLSITRPFFGKGGLLTLKGPSRVQYAAALVIESYTANTYPGLLNGLLGAPFEFVLAQSFTFISRAVAITRLKRQQSRMINAGDVAKSQIAQLDDAMDDIQSNVYVMGAHHLSLIVRSPNKDDLNDHISLAGTVFSEAGMNWLREDAGLSGCFWSQLPGNFKYRIRIGDINSRNFAGFSCLHNYPTGRIDGTQWGPALTMFKTVVGSPYYYSFHKADPDPEAKFDPEHKELAHAVIIGMSGAGKTVLGNHLTTMLQKFLEDEREGGTGVLFDKDLGASIAVKALGGRYFAIKNGIPTGWQPLHLKNDPKNLLFVQELIKVLIHHTDHILQPDDEKKIVRAVESVMGNPLRNIEGMRMEARRMSSILEFFNPREKNGIYSRLAPWCEGGHLDWLFDNEVDTLDVQGTNLLGFDVTEFLDNPVTRTPTVLYLLHRINELLDGRRVPIFMDEFWKLLGNDALSALIEDKLVTMRKQNGFLVMATQFPEQVIKSPICDAIIQQTATKIFLPNPSANRDAYVNHFKTTVAEFEIIKALGEKSRQFLVKQGGNSVVCELNLKGFNDELAVLSANTATAGLVERIIETHGDNPEVWLPIFHRMRKGIAVDE